MTYTLHDVSKTESYEQSKLRLLIAYYTSAFIFDFPLHIYCQFFPHLPNSRICPVMLAAEGTTKISPALYCHFRPCVAEFCCTLDWTGFLQTFGNTES